ncbi:MAG: insulinase family protein [Holosporales bacterium]|jgi:zinc protease|nr:insulinase family protein [Holosporales bacterium]
MKSKLLRILFLTLFGCASFYLFRSWKVHKEKTVFEVEAPEFTDTALDINELSTSFPNPVWFVKTDSPVICFKMTFKNEGDRSFCSTPCLLDVVIGTLVNGAGDKDGIALKKALSEKSIDLAISNDADDIIVTVSCLERYFEDAVGLLCDIMSKAHLKQEKLEIAKQAVITSMQQSKFDTDRVATEKLSNLIYPAGHPYRWTYDGSIKAVQKYTKADADKCYASIFDSKNALIVLVGNIDTTRIIDAFNKIYESTTNKTNDFKDGQQQTELLNYGTVAHVELDNPQSSVVIAFPGILKNSAEKFAAKMANIALGGCGFSSRLQKSLRDVDGLVYRINSSINDGDLQSVACISAKMRPENVEKAIELVKEVCQKFYDKGLTQEELDAFKIYVYANNDLPSNGDKLEFVSTCRSNSVLVNEVNGYYGHYYKLSLNEVNTTLKKVFDPAKVVVVSCGQLMKKSNVSRSAKRRSESIESGE